MWPQYGFSDGQQFIVSSLLKNKKEHRVSSAVRTLNLLRSGILYLIPSQIVSYINTALNVYIGLRLISYRDHRAACKPINSR